MALTNDLLWTQPSRFSLGASDTRSPTRRIHSLAPADPQGSLTGWLFGVASRAAPERAPRRGTRPLLRPPRHRYQRFVGGEPGAGNHAPTPSPPNLIHVTPRRQAAQRAQPGPCARRTLLRSRDEASRDRQVPYHRRYDRVRVRSFRGPGRQLGETGPSPCGLGRGAKRRGSRAGGTSPDRGAARLRSGAEVGRPAGPNRESQEVLRELPLQGSV
jgi:hypothetical protein